jgi:hypothetical protein
VQESWRGNYTQLIQGTPDTIVEELIPEAEATPSQKTRESHTRVARTAESSGGLGYNGEERYYESDKAGDTGK